MADSHRWNQSGTLYNSVLFCYINRMSNYRFSPIKNETELKVAIAYVAEQTEKLALKITRKTYSITSLTIFSHDENEYENLKKILFSWGGQIAENNGPYVKLRTTILLPNGDSLVKLRIRKPDIERPQVGCNDFKVENYEVFKQEQLPSHSDNLKLIVRPEYEMVEFHDNTFDVLAYVVSKSLI